MQRFYCALQSMLIGLQSIQVVLKNRLLLLMSPGNLESWKVLPVASSRSRMWQAHETWVKCEEHCSQARALGLAGGGELAKLLQLREEAGELAAGDERRFRALSRATERELLQVRAALSDDKDGCLLPSMVAMPAGDRPACTSSCACVLSRCQCNRCRHARPVIMRALKALLVEMLAPSTAAVRFLAIERELLKAHASCIKHVASCMLALSAVFVRCPALPASELLQARV